MRTKSGELLSKSNTSLTITSIITGVSASKRPSLSLSNPAPSAGEAWKPCLDHKLYLLFAANESWAEVGQNDTFLQQLC